MFAIIQFGIWILGIVVLYAIFKAIKSFFD